MPHADFRIRAYGDVAVVEFLADRYASNRREDVDQAMWEAAAASPQNLLVLDFARVEVLSSLALQPIQATLRRLKQHGGRAAATGGGELVRKLLGFFPDLPQYPERINAIGALSEAAGSVYASEVGEQ